MLLKPIERLGGSNADTIEIIPEERQPRILAELEAVVRAGREGDRLFSGPEICYAARPNSLVIRANDLIGKCTVARNEPANSIRRLLPDGWLKIDNSRLRPWVRGWASRDWDALECPYAGLPHNQSSLLQVSVPLGLSS